MANIEFNEGYTPQGKQSWGDNESSSHLARLLIKIKVARDVTTANYILVGVATVAFTLSIIIFGDTFLKIKSQQIEKAPPISKSEMMPVIKGFAPNITDSMLDRLPEKFYREDIPQEIVNVLPQNLINSVPPRPR